MVPMPVSVGLDSSSVGYSPLHEEYPCHQAVGDQHAHAWKVRLAELSPHALVETAHTVVGVGGAFSVGDSVEEVAVVGSLLPHALHLGGTWLKVAKILFTKTRLFKDGDFVTREGRRRRIVGGERAEDAFGGLAGTPVRRGEELEGIVWFEKRTKLPASFLGLYGAKVVNCELHRMKHPRTYLTPAQLGELDAVVWNELVDVAILVSFGLGMAHQNDHLFLRQPRARSTSHGARLHTPEVCPCLR